MKKANGIFCIEGAWSVDLRDDSTISPILNLLASKENIPIIYHTATTKEELFHLISKWRQKRYNKYPILYIASHGTRRGVMLYPYKTIPLSELAEALVGKCKNRIIFFGSCSIFGSNPKILQNLLEKSGAYMLLGYSIGIPWLESTAMDLLLLFELQKHKFEGRTLRFIKQKIDILSAKFPELQLKYLTKE